MNSSSLKPQDTATNPPSPPMHVLISRDNVQFPVPTRAAYFCLKLRRAYRGIGTKERIPVDVDTETLAKAAHYLNIHCGCNDAGAPAEHPLSQPGIKEWARTVFLDEPKDVLEKLLYCAQQLDIPDMAKAIEDKLKSIADD